MQVNSNSEIIVGLWCSGEGIPPFIVAILCGCAFSVCPLPQLAHGIWPEEEAQTSQVAMSADYHGVRWSGNSLRVSSKYRVTLACT
jgi:hypothetical protein